MLKQIARIKSKICPYCGEKFSELDFPQSFKRMITCDSIECRKKRRIERVKRLTR